MKEIVDILLKKADKKYKEFSVPLTPGIDAEKVIGVRIPEIRKLAKELYKNNSTLVEKFMNEMPHEYYEENQLHGFLICEIKDYTRCVCELEKWLVCVDNWAVCDGKTPKVLKKNKIDFINKVDEWISTGKTYYIRYAVGQLMSLYLDKDFNESILERVAKIRSEEYYVNMMISWFFATALAKQWDMTFPYIENHRLDDWCNNKTIQKARESFRVSNEHKEILKRYKK